MNRPPLRTPQALAAAGVLTVALMASGCSVLTSATTRPGVIAAVGAENEYADVISQIGGQYVQVTAIMDNPNTDPHSFEASPQVAEDVSAAQLVVQNGLGYDTFMNRIEAAAPDAHRKVVDVQTLLGLPDATANPHLWYKPTTMPAVANAVADDLAELDPDHAALLIGNFLFGGGPLTSYAGSVEPMDAASTDWASVTLLRCWKLPERSTAHLGRCRPTS